MKLTMIGLLVSLMMGLAYAQGGPAPLPTLSPVETKLLEQHGRLLEQLAAANREISALQAMEGLCHQQLGPLQARENAGAIERDLEEVKRLIEAAHDGYAFDVRTRTFTPKNHEPGKDTK